jgi:uncharacterized membrane protein YkvA (DUF1232 family)
MPAPKRLATVRNLANALRIATRPGGPTIGERLHAVPRMVRATVRGDYHGTSTARLMAIAAAAGYVLSPVDLLPEGVLGIFGLADDAMVMSWLAAQLVAETEDFLIWEKGTGRFTGKARTSAGSGPAATAGGGRDGGGDGGTSAAAGQTVPGDVVR